jgi:hypothetical protein
LLMFLRRIWPTCTRPSSVTIPMRPPPHKDSLAAADDNDDDKRDMHDITLKYSSLWQEIIRRTDANAPSAQRWMANLFDAWRRRYINVTNTDWETAFREFWAAADIISSSLIQS